MARSALLLFLSLAIGCTTLRNRADSAYEHGRYREAAELYDKVLAEHPNDTGARSRRDAARTSVLREILVDVDAKRRSAHIEIALARLGELLEQRDAWGGAIDPSLAQPLAEEVVWAGAYVASSVADRARSKGPLAAEHLAGTFDNLLAHRDFAARRAQIRENVEASGRLACATLAPSATTPYWSWLVDRYCRHFGSSPVTVPPLPNLYGDLVVEGAIAGQTDAQVANLHEALTAAFRGSVWFASDAPGTHALVDGRISTSFSSMPVTLTADWTESVPYTAYETTSVAYQEPYDDTEYYTESVPTTEYRTETRPCGSTTCTESVPTTVYHSEQRTRTVTKYRTAYRDETNPVTRYRDEPRTFTYSGIERAGEYQSALRIRLDAPSLTSTIVNNFTRNGVDHDASFSAAGVSPERANLPTQSEFAARENDRLRDQLLADLNRQYAQQYCSAGSYTLESAATCAYLGAKLPSAAETTITSLLGGDAPYIGVVLRR
ncbi:MAG: tetratricopeptide repeat protein [Kofleriaceae bacterium]|nr:tetratricopeptide repeat protein [Kofleriaceae bacterium]